jgi:amino acid permease
MKLLIIFLLLCPIFLILALDLDKLTTLQFVGVFAAFLAFVGLIALLYKHSNLFKFNLNNKA